MEKGETVSVTGTVVDAGKTSLGVLSRFVSFIPKSLQPILSNFVSIDENTRRPVRPHEDEAG